MFPNLLLSKPVWLIMILGIYNFIQSRLKPSWVIVLSAITFLYLLVELKPIGLVHDYYLMPFLPWIYIVIAYGIKMIIDFKYGCLVIICICLYSAGYTSNYCTNKWDVNNALNIDIFTHSEALKHAVPNDKLCIILNDLSLIHI